MTNKEALETLKLHGDIEFSGDPKRIIAFMAALTVAESAIEKQIPMKPQKVEILNGYFKCPLCGYYVVKHDYNKYCARCGQAIDWE